MAANMALPLLLFVVSLMIYVPTMGTERVNGDSYAASVSAWRVATTGKPWLDGVNTSALEGWAKHVDMRVTGTDGHVLESRTAGVVLAAVPFYWLSGAGRDPDSFRIAVGSFAAAAWVAAAASALFLLLRRHVAQRVALTGVLIFQFATPVWSVAANDLWTHSVTILCLAGAALSLARDRWWAAGVFMGLGILARPHLAVVSAVLGLGMAWSHRDWKIAVKMAAPSLGCLALLVVWNRAFFGQWSVQGGYAGYALDGLAGGSPIGFEAVFVNYAGFLLSPDRGFFVWSPLVLVLLPGLLRAWGELPPWTRWMSIAGIAYTIAQLRINYFAGGDGFYGYRHGLELLTCLVPALALSWPSQGRIARFLTGPVVGLQFAAIYLGATVDGFFVPIENVWQDNSFWMAFRVWPAFVGVYTALLVGMGLALSIWLERRSRKNARP